MKRKNVKKRKKWLIMSLFGLLLSVCGHAQTDQTAVVVLLKNGSTVPILLDDKPELRIEGTMFIVVCETLNINRSFQRSDIADFHFVPVTGIDKVEANEMRIVRTNDDNVQLLGIHEDDLPISVYSLSGHRLFPKIALSNGSADISLKTLKKGTYLVKIGNRNSIKILKK